MHIMTMSNGDTVDLHSQEGCYKYVGQFLVENGASSNIFASLETLAENRNVKLLLAGILLDRFQPLAPHHTAAIREYLGELDDEESQKMVRTGIVPAEKGADVKCDHQDCNWIERPYEFECIRCGAIIEKDNACESAEQGK